MLSSNTSSISLCPDNMVNFGALTAEIGSGVWGTPTNFNGFHVLAALLHGTLVGVSQTAALNRGRHLYSAGRPSRWALAHISSFVIYFAVQVVVRSNSTVLRSAAVVLQCSADFRPAPCLAYVTGSTV